jgi:hypothetical protein
MRKVDESVGHFSRLGYPPENLPALPVLLSPSHHSCHFFQSACELICSILPSQDNSTSQQAQAASIATSPVALVPCIASAWYLQQDDDVAEFLIFLTRVR